MGLSRVLEPEVMDTFEEAFDYDSMDHAAVNAAFVRDLLSDGPVSGEVLDLGTGTALIPIELCKQVESCKVVAVDLAIAMLDLARYRLEVAGLTQRVALAHIDAKRLPFADGRFALVMSNSIVHHIPEPLEVLREAVRVTAAGGRLFFRDLLRPDDESTVDQLVEQYAAGANDHQRQLFAQSLRAALSLDEIRDLVREVGGDPAEVCATSDRHWTWSAAQRGE